MFSAAACLRVAPGGKICLPCHAATECVLLLCNITTGEVGPVGHRDAPLSHKEGVEARVLAVRIYPPAEKSRHVGQREVRQGCEQRRVIRLLQVLVQRDTNGWYLVPCPFDMSMMVDARSTMRDG